MVRRRAAAAPRLALPHTSPRAAAGLPALARLTRRSPAAPTVAASKSGSSRDAREAGLLIEPSTAHRLVSVAVLVAAKFASAPYAPNSPKVLPLCSRQSIRPGEFPTLERSFLRAIDYRLFVNDQEFLKFCGRLENGAPKPRKRKAAAAEEPRRSIRVLDFAGPALALVTGGNKGIGVATCKQLASNGGITVVLTARDQGRGTAAVEELKRMGFSDLVFHQLDITDASSVARLADFLKNRFGRLDILVNNAAVGGTEHPSLCSLDEKMDTNQRLEWLLNNCRESDQATKRCLRTNYYGTKQVIEALLPLLHSSADGRIVNVSSSVGLLRHFRNEELTRELDDIDHLTEKRLDELLDMFLIDFEDGRVQARGWPAPFPAYKVAKAAMNAYSRILARRHPALCVNCVDPGITKTDMTLNTGHLTPEEGAHNVVRVALLPDGELTGAYFHEGQQASFL